MNNYGILTEDLAAILKIFESDEMIQEVILFGSRAKGSFKDGSDIDLAIKGNNLTINNLLNLSTALDDLFLPFKFDLIIFNRIQEPKLLNISNELEYRFLNEQISRCSVIKNYPPEC
ncbi:MAG TPA: nucleotidyltransferase domain-containing protein [Prolixibacteraceae bacterium]|nr:nucleotidyltransferase domain-containing protein [Prolixibacteraceae bacterium]